MYLFNLRFIVNSLNFSFSVGVSCGPLAAPSNGHVNTSAGTSFKDKAVYSCDNEYTLNGTAERTCQANGQWSGSAPSCESEMLQWNHQQCV